MNFLAWQELNHDGFDVEHWRAIDGIQFSDEKLRPFHTNHTADRAADAVWPILTTLREDAYGWPRAIVPRVARALDNF
nr:hypothetical protein [Methylomonas sp. LW13]